jgi:hypothetical protein
LKETLLQELPGFDIVDEKLGTLIQAGLTDLNIPYIPPG